MFCPNCDTQTSEDICPKCKTDILQYTLIDEMSYKFYNKGLSLAKRGDISGAIFELEKAVVINSNNITALNLLGLCYDRVGRIADASKFWIRSCLIEEDNVAGEYIKVVEDKASKRERINESIKMYNQGLIYAKQKSFDIATIQLKNCIDRNGDFVEALNLLSLIYITQGEIQKAVPLLRRAIKIDNSNAKTKLYLEEIGYSSNSRNENKEPRRLEKAKTSQKGYRGIGIGFISGIILVVLATFIFNISSFNIGDLINKNSYEEQITKLDMTISANEIEIQSLVSENEELKTQNESLQQSYDDLSSYVYLDEAQVFIDNGDYLNASKMIESINTETLSADKIDQYNNLKNEAYPNASRNLYDSGVSKYGVGEYENALIDLEESIKYGGTVKDYYPSTLFYIGRCKEGLNDINSAKEYYQKILDEYPNDDIVYSAKSRLNTIS